MNKTPKRSQTHKDQANRFSLNSLTETTKRKWTSTRNNVRNFLFKGCYIYHKFYMFGI